MVAIRLDQFGGMIPIVSRRLLPDTAATLAANVNTESGEVRPIQLPVLVEAFLSTMHRALRIPHPDGVSAPVWLTGTSKFSRFFQTPLVNDAYNRFVWLDGNAPGTAVYPVVNSFARIDAGNTGADAPIRLGVPRPGSAPSLAVVGGTATNITRSYVYTYIDVFGQEGQPSDPVTVTGAPDGSWNLSALAAPPVGREVTTIRIYRTITGSGGITLYYRVADLGIVTTYSDAIADSAVLLSPLTLASTTWAEAPEMEGMALMPGGFFVGWNQRNLFFSEPYRPWAWPPEYVLSTPNKIVGCGIVADSLIVLTEGRPTVVSGQRPDALTIITFDTPEPCVSPNSIVSSPEGVYFAGSNGVMLVNAGGAVNISRALISEAQWRESYTFDDMSLVRVNAALLLALSPAGVGFILDLHGDRPMLQPLSNFNPVESAWTDNYTGSVFLASGDSVWEWAAAGAPYTVGRWESKEWHFRKPVNFGALKVFYTDIEPGTIDSIISQPAEPVEGGPWLEEAAIPNYCLANVVAPNESPDAGALPPGVIDPDAEGFPLWYGLEPSFVVAPIALDLPSGIAVYIELWADGVLRWASYVMHDIMYRPASGFKAAVWKVVILTRVPVLAVHLAETPKELANA